MRLIRFQDEQGTVCMGREKDSGVAELCQGGFVKGYKPTGKTAGIRRLLAPVAPVNVFCIGLNYRRHAQESRAPFPQYPVVFMKPTTAVAGPGDPVRIPRVAAAAGEVDYECELAVVIGRQARDVPEGKALDYVFGYTAANDISARAWQRACGGQWVHGKSFDSFCPIGPALVTADEIPDPQTLGIKMILNGQVMQDSRTSDMIFPVAKLVSFLSEDTTLLPGTLILTGTPGGVGGARTPPVWLKHGDELVVELEKIGRLANRVVGAHGQ